MNSESQLKNAIVYIPGYKCEKNIEDVFDRLTPELKKNAKAILVVDNASPDNTEDVVLKYKREHSIHNLHIIRLEKNLGYGGSQKIAYRFAIENDADAVVMVHGDGQYAPDLADKIIKPILDSNAQMVFGSRIAGNPLKGGMPLHRYLGNRALTTFQNIFLGARLTEYHSGYRAYDVKSLKELNFEMMSDDYHFDTEMIIQMIAKKKIIKEVVIPTHYGDEENHVNIWKYGIDVVITTLTYFFHKIGVRKSENWSRIISDSAREPREVFLRKFLPLCRFDGILYGKESLKN